MKLKLTTDQMHAIVYEEELPDFDYEIVEGAKWEVGHKIETCEVIFKYKDKYYSLSAYRTGDYYQGYETDFVDDEAIEVQKESYISYRWVQVTVDENLSEPTSCYFPSNLF